MLCVSLFGLTLFSLIHWFLLQATYRGHTHVADYLVLIGAQSNQQITSTTLHKDQNGTLTLTVTRHVTKPNTDGITTTSIENAEDALSYDFPYLESHSDVIKAMKVIKENFQTTNFTT